MIREQGGTPVLPLISGKRKLGPELLVKQKQFIHFNRRGGVHLVIDADKLVDLVVGFYRSSSDALF